MAFTISQSPVPPDVEQATITMWRGLDAQDCKSVEGLLSENVQLRDINRNVPFNSKRSIYNYLRFLYGKIGYENDAQLHLAMVREYGFNHEKLLFWYPCETSYNYSDGQPSVVHVWDWVKVTEKDETVQNVIFTSGQIFGSNRTEVQSTFRHNVTNYEKIFEAKKVEIELKRSSTTVEHPLDEKLIGYQATPGWDLFKDNVETGKRRGCSIL